MPPQKYTIIVSGQPFVFTRNQLESEPGNYFATYFFGDFKEAASATKELELDTEPLFFKLIQAHLRGYKVLPIQNAYVPDYTSKKVALENLRRDAEFFGLTRLVTLIDQEITAGGVPENGVIGERIYQISFHRAHISPEDDRKAYPEYYNPDGSRRTVSVSPETYQDMITYENYRRMDRPECDQCWRASQGWQFAGWRSQTFNYSSELHCVLESRVV